MANEFTPNSATTTNFTDNVDTFSVDFETVDGTTGYGKRWWDYPDSNTYLGYYKQIPELASMLDVLAKRVCGMGWTSTTHQTILENINGWGEDSFDSIMKSMLKEKKYLGDSMSEIVRGDNGQIINIKKLWLGDMRVICNSSGQIIGYQQRANQPDGKPRNLKPEQVLHFCNDRIGNEIHGTSITQILKTTLDSLQEAYNDERVIRHRDKAIGIAKYKTDDTGKISYINTQIENSVNKGEMLGIPEDTVEIEDWPAKGPKDRISYLQQLENRLYKVGGVPKALVTSEGFTEAGGKAGLLSFEPNELAEKRELEQDLWNQLGIRIQFARSPSLLGEAVGTEQKNAGQTGIQNNETQITARRSE